MQNLEEKRRKIALTICETLIVDLQDFTEKYKSLMNSSQCIDLKSR